MLLVDLKGDLTEGSFLCANTKRMITQNEECGQIPREWSPRMKNVVWKEGSFLTRDVFPWRFYSIAALM